MARMRITKTRYELIREIEQETGRPIGILMDLQGPKLRVGTFPNGVGRVEDGRHLPARPR